MAMINPVEAVLALDNMPIGARIVACGIDEDGTASGVLFEHKESKRRGRRWEDRTREIGAATTALQIVRRYDDMVLVHMPKVTDA